jgi:FtsP/CotA-like multicopper oxidase with cupredoxin domain
MYFSCTGILRYGSVSQVPYDLSSLPEPSLANETDLLSFTWNNPYETKLTMDAMPRRTADREYFLFSTQEHTLDSLGTRWVINNATLDMSRMDTLMTPLLYNLYHGNSQDMLNDVTYTINDNELVDIVIQNTVALNGVCESHPFHLHGHKFWLHSYGTGMYDKSSSESVPIAYPVLRDTVILYASEYAYFTLNRNSSNHRKPCGWIKLRLMADNPGIWMLHCHIGAHAFMGMNVLLKEGINKLTMEYLSQH